MGRGVGKIIAGAVVTAVGILAGGNGFLISAGISLMAGGAVDSLTKRPSLAIGNRDFGTNVAEAVTGLPIVYGPMRLGAMRVFAETTDSGHYLWIVGALCHGPVSQIGAVYFDGVMALDANGRPITGATPSQDFLGYAHVWKAYGGAGQWTVSAMGRGDQTVTGIIKVNLFDKSDDRYHVSFSSAHGFVVGDCITVTSGLTALPGGNGGSGFTVVEVVSSTQVTIRVPFSFNNGGTKTGTVDLYTPRLASPLFRRQKWTTRHNGKGVAWIAVRLLYDENRFAGGVPRITVDVMGLSGVDPRNTSTVAISSVAQVLGPEPYGNVAQVTTAAAHGLNEGDLVEIAGAGAEVNGRQRVDRVVSSTVFTMFVPLSAALGAGGTVRPLTGLTNPVLALRDYLTSPAYGLGADASELDDARFITEANYADETVYLPVPNTSTFTATHQIASTAAGAATTVTTLDAHGYSSGQTVEIRGAVEIPDGRYTITVTGAMTFTVPYATGAAGGAGGIAQAQETGVRFAVGGALDANQTLKTNLEAILAACRGTLVWQGGVYAPSIRRPTSPVLALTEDDIIGNWSFSLPGQQEMVNAVRVTFVNPANQYQADQIDVPNPAEVNQFLIDDQGQLNRRDLELALVQHMGRATHIAGVRRRESRVGILCAVTCTERALQCQVGDLISVTHETPGWAAKPFWVNEVALAPDGTVRLSLEAYDATCYDLEATDDVPFVDTTDLPDPLEIDPPANLQLLVDADLITLHVTWDASPTAGVTRYQLQYKRSADQSWTEGPFVGPEQLLADIAGLRTAVSYDVRVRAIKGESVSDWITATQTTSSYDPASTVPLIMQCRTTLVTAGTTDTQEVWKVEAVGEDGTRGNVVLTSVTGSAALASGPAVGVSTADGGSGVLFTFNRGTALGPDGGALFHASLTGYTSDDDSVVITAQGRDTVPLQVQLQPNAAASDANTAAATLLVTDGVGDAGAATVTVHLQGLSGVTVNGVAVTDGSTVSATPGTSYPVVVPRPASDQPQGRISVTATKASRVLDSDSLDVSPKPPAVPAVISPPTAGIDFVSEDDSQVTLATTGVVGAGGAGPLQYSWRTDAAAWSAYSTTHANQSVPRHPKNTRTFWLKVKQADGQESAPVSYPVTGAYTAINAGTGQVDPTQPLSGIGRYIPRATDVNGYLLDSNTKDSRSALLSGMFRAGTDTAASVVETAALGFLDPTAATGRIPNKLWSVSDGFSLSGQQAVDDYRRSTTGFRDQAGGLASVANDSRGALLNGMFRLNTDNLGGVLDGGGFNRVSATDMTGNSVVRTYIPDNRNSNDPPSAYSRGVVNEFKDAGAIGIPGYAPSSGTFGNLRTEKPWGDSSGGYATQTWAGSDDRVWKRSAPAGGASWVNPWRIVTESQTQRIDRATGHADSTMADSRSALLSSMFRAGTDTTASVVDGTGSPLTGGARAYLGLDASNYVQTGVRGNAVIGDVPASRIAKQSGNYFTEHWDQVPGTANGWGGSSANCSLANDTNSTMGQTTLVVTSYGALRGPILAFNPAKLYRIRCKVRTAAYNSAGAGSSVWYIGVYGRDYTGNASNSNAGAMYVCAAGWDPVPEVGFGGYKEYVGWVKGANTTGGGGIFSASADPRSPISLNTGTVTIEPLIYAGYSGTGGTFLIDYYVIDEFDEDGSMRTYSVIQNDNASLYGTVKDARSALLNAMFRAGTDTTASIVDGSGSPLAGGARAYLGLDANSRLAAQTKAQMITVGGSISKIFNTNDSPFNPISWNASTTYISLAAFRLYVGSAGYVSYASRTNVASADGQPAPGLVYYVYMIDPTYAGGSPSCYATTSPRSVFLDDGTVFVGQVTCITGSNSTGTCVAPETPVLLADGREVPAGDVRIGDIVSTRHEETLAWGNFMVLGTMTVEAPERVRLLLEDGRQVVATPNHRVHVAGRGWTQLRALSIGEALTGDEGREHVVLDVVHEGAGPVVLLTVEGAKTYVSAGFLSHNQKPLS